MDASFTRNLKIVSGVHLALIVFLLASGWFRGCERKNKDVIIPMEFLVEVPPAEQGPQADDIPMVIKQPVKKPAENPVPVKKPVKKTVKISHKVVQNPNITQPVKKPLTPEEIQKLLERGAKPSDRTVIPPTDDGLYYALVRQAFHDAWVQPSHAEAGDAIVEAEIRFALDGSVISARIKTPSGVTVMDTSVAKALGYVKRVSGLTRDFISRHDRITIDFKVE